MNNNEKKDKVQKEAIKSWLKVDKIGSLEIITGLGKTFCALHALYTMPKDDSITHIFLAEVNDREKDLIEQIAKYNKIFNRDVYKDYNLEFYCYQSAYKWKGKKFGLVIADEIHDSLSISYSKFYFNNDYQALIGLSATINKNTEYVTKSGNIITKGDLLNKIAPICYKYNLKKAKEDSTTRDLKIHVIPSYLDNTKKYIKAGNHKKRFYQTEQASYDYWNTKFKQALYVEDLQTRELKIGISSKKRSDIIYKSINKIELTKKLVDNLTSKSIIFSNSLDSLLQVTPNVVSSRNKDIENERIKNDFNDNKIKIIGSFKKLKQGANLNELDNVILMSYYGQDKDFTQRVGRLRDNGKVGNVFIFLTYNTQEEVWFKNMLQNFDNLNIVYHNDIEECLQKLKESDK